MNPTKFKSQNVTYAENQPEYLPLPAHKDPDGVVTSCWKMTLIERVQAIFHGWIYLEMHTFNQPVQPVMMYVSDPIEKVAP